MLDEPLTMSCIRSVTWRLDCPRGAGIYSNCRVLLKRADVTPRPGTLILGTTLIHLLEHGNIKNIFIHGLTSSFFFPRVPNNFQAYIPINRLFLL